MSSLAATSTTCAAANKLPTHRAAAGYTAADAPKTPPTPSQDQPYSDMSPCTLDL